MDREGAFVLTDFFGIGSRDQMLARDHMHADIAGMAHEVAHDRAVISSNQRVRSDLPITICVTLLARE